MLAAPVLDEQPQRETETETEVGRRLISRQHAWGLLFLTTLTSDCTGLLFSRMCLEHLETTIV
jgi:hypothetical protein